ncbi:MAG TPA: hypothetical protein VLA90_02635 [Actinomycetota bacterium]|nr:hypothetical protein [Actinomycetota bacterium]
MKGVLAHETWFTPERPAYDWTFLAEPATLALVAVALAVAVAWRLVGRRLPRPELPFLAPLGRLSPWIPRLLAVHAGVSLLAQAARGTYLAPALTLPDNAWGIALRFVEGLVGVWLISGIRIRWAALAVVLSGPLGMPAYGFVPILERMDLLGVALFLFLLPPGEHRWGAASVDGPTVERAVLWLRLLVGGALIVLAFTEKLARPALALLFLERFPAFNILQTVGLDVGDTMFVRVAGAVELLFGLLIVSGRLPQLVVVLAGIPFNATLFFLGTEELIGHLPIYGAMLALLVYGSDRTLAGVVDTFSPREPVVLGPRELLDTAADRSGG